MKLEEKLIGREQGELGSGRKSLQACLNLTSDACANIQPDVGIIAQISNISEDKLMAMGINP